MDNNRFLKPFAVISASLVLLSILYFGAVTLSRIGETKVSITVIPADAAILLNDVPLQAGATYIKPGSYTLRAQKEGFSEDILKLDVGNEPLSVGLIPSPVSDSAKRYFVDNPELQTERESIGGARASNKGLQIAEKSPLVRLLPYTDVTGPFTIDYGFKQDGGSELFLVISDSSPEGRLNALKWIHQQGYEPEDYEIIFDDFNNPLTVGTDDGR